MNDEMNDEQPRAKTAEEVRADFMNTCRTLADFWAGPGAEGKTARERLQGLVHSILCIFDGVNGGLPAFDIVASPHPDDKEFHRSEGENWIEPGTVINNCSLHDTLYKGAWGTDP